MTLSDIFRNPRLYVDYWAEKRKVYSTDLPTFILDYHEEVAKFNIGNQSVDKKPIKYITRNLLEAAFEEYLATIPNKLRNGLKSAITCDVENLKPLESWVRAVTGKLESDDLNVMAHWLWLVKRNVYGFDVVHHIMPIITSPKQGGGKSTAVRKLVTPVEELMLELKVPQVVDERSFTLFTNYLVGFFDEMAGADKVEISDFKRNVTSSTLTYRPMRTNTQVKIPNICSFIGASNSQIYEIIKDTTGVRRFFAINALDKLDHVAINTIDYIQLWKGINERRERGYFEEVQIEVSAKQEEMQMKDEVLLFLEDYSIMPEGKDTVVVNGKQLYDEYVLHTKNAGIRFQVTAQTFWKKLRDTGLQATRKKDKSKVMRWFFAINPNGASMLKGEKYEN